MYLRLFVIRVLLPLFLAPALVAAQPTFEDARAKANDGDLNGAIELLEQILVRNPEDPQARFLMGLVYVRQGESGAAISQFSALATDHPELPEPHNNLAVLYAAAGQFEDAREALLAAIRTHPSYATAHENLGDIYARMAAAAYDKALSLDRGNQAAQSKLGLVNELFSISEVVAVEPSVEFPQSTRTDGASEAGRVLAAVREWADAWSRQDVEDYLALYGTEFEVPKRMTRMAWEAWRHERLKKPNFIDVDIDDLVAERNGADRYRVTFTQRYRSSSYQDSTRKILALGRERGHWRILSEVSIP